MQMCVNRAFVSIRATLAMRSISNNDEDSTNVRRRRQQQQQEEV